MPSEPTFSASYLSVVIQICAYSNLCYFWLSEIYTPGQCLLLWILESAIVLVQLFAHGVHLILSSFLLRQYINPSPAIKCPFQRSTGYPRDLPFPARSCSTNTGSWWRWSHTAWLFCVWPEWPRCCSRAHWILFFLHRYFFREPKVLFQSAASIYLE